MVLFLNRNKMETSRLLTCCHHFACVVASDLRSQKFGSMKDSGDGIGHQTETQDEEKIPHDIKNWIEI